VTQFAAASAERVYAFDHLNTLVVLDAASGATLNRMPSDGLSTALVNDQTDRLYLVSSDGRVQCLHEIGLTQPLVHTPPPPTTPPTEATPAAPAETPPAQQLTPPSDNQNPFGQLPTPPSASDDPFGGNPTPAPAATPPANNPPPGGGNPFEDSFGGR
jgi:hypothetical protein